MTRKRLPILKALVRGVFLAVIAGGWTAAYGSISDRSPQAAGALQPVEAKTCIECHEAQTTVLGRTRHGTLDKSCLSCHSDGAAEHVEAEKKRNEPGPIKSFANMKAADVTKTCLECHEKGKQANRTGGKHDRRGVSCVSCHSVHSFQSTAAQLKFERDVETCNTCHPAIRAKLQRSSHHPVREGKISCTSCHNPHDGTNPKMVNAAWVNEKCYECHTEKRGPFLWEHAPVRENCMLCHDPHGSNHDKLLASKLPYLCQRCHLNTRHPGTLYDARNAAAGVSPSNRAVEHACKNCHQNVHGSNAPSGPYLGR